MSTTEPGRPVATAAIGPRFAPDELRRRLGLKYHFSDEQVEVMTAVPDDPLLIVAGAGSGKTELMALRVIWLIVNQYVRPEQVLGLTFTRKAAGELAHRIRLYLGRAKHLLGHDPHLVGEPTVATYHSFAARIVREHGMRCGDEPGMRLLTEASCWQLADAIVRHHDSAAMRDFPLGQASATAAVLSLAGELSEHLRDPDDIEAFTSLLTARIEAKPGRVLKPVQDLLDRQKGRLALVPLLRAYAARKRELEAMDFGDQLRRAATVARDHPDVADAERDRFRAVLLDEYQDTSQAQVVLLTSLFGQGHPVTAVGDPCQSIYAWRGASAGTLERFRTDFPDARGEPASAASLSVSFRNAPHILAVANELSDPLRRDRLSVKALRAASSYLPKLPGAAVRCAYTHTYVDEAQWIADSVVGIWQNWQTEHGHTPTTAVLVRARKQIAPIEKALRAQGLPVEVVGLGGLLDNPEVRDVVCTLRVLCDPTAGAALLRLLTGSRWRVGARDVVALYRRARSLAFARRDHARPEQSTPDSRPAEGALATPEVDLSTERLDDATLAEALDDLGPASAYSAEGFRRFGLMRDELRGLRHRLSQSLPDLVADVAATIGLDVEVAVGSGQASAAGLARTHLDAFAEVAARFAAQADSGSLPAFLAYLDAAEDEERGLPPGEVEVVPGAVQILTVHAAKGLEWDVVAVTGLCADAFPAKPKSSDHWLVGIGVLPFPLRGDAASLPALSLEAAVDCREVRDGIDQFDEAWQRHQEREERRLAYVAVTRPRHVLLCSGYRWGERLTRPREPSIFLNEIVSACQAGAGVVELWAPDLAEGETNPTLAEEVFDIWPVDPLGQRRPAIEEAARLVRAARVHAARAATTSSTSDTDDPVVAQWQREAQLLLAERERLRARQTIDVVLPEQLSVSALVALQRDPARLARRLRRPVPEKPDVYARRGTAFHLWLERHFGGGELFDLDDLPGCDDDGAADDEEFETLQKAFLGSPWAQRVPARVEVPFATVVGGVVVRGRMDAVFTVPEQPGCYEVIDWKTGQRPTGADARAAAVQLAAYRLAWAELAGIAVGKVSAGFHYVRESATVRPADLLDAQALVALVTGLPEAT